MRSHDRNRRTESRRHGHESPCAAGALYTGVSGKRRGIRHNAHSAIRNASASRFTETRRKAPLPLRTRPRRRHSGKMSSGGPVEQTDRAVQLRGGTVFSPASKGARHDPGERPDNHSVGRAASTSGVSREACGRSAVYRLLMWPPTKEPADRWSVNGCAAEFRKFDTSPTWGGASWSHGALILAPGRPPRASPASPLYGLAPIRPRPSRRLTRRRCWADRQSP